MNIPSFKSITMTMLHQQLLRDGQPTKTGSNLSLHAEGGTEEEITAPMD